MPELPEVETIRRGLSKQILNSPISNVIIHQSKLRWFIPNNLKKILLHKQFTAITRRGKYLIFTLSDNSGFLLIHLGMTGRLILAPQKHVIQKHEHVIFEFAETKQALCFIDPRRFGAILFCKAHKLPEHSLLKQLGVEPLKATFNADYLCSRAQKSKLKIKPFLMNSKILVGVGNIYANEALFASAINPMRLAKNLTPSECARLVKNIKQILQLAIKKGGTTIRDYVNGHGAKGGFQKELKVYDRAGERCYVCHTIIKTVRQGQRSTFYCPKCQK